MQTTDYSNLVDQLIESEFETWPMLRQNYAALADVSVRTLQVGGSKIVLQFNPARIRSSAAKVDAASLKARKCFLCSENQPVEQHMIEWEGKYKIQVNPYPIFPRHLTIACLQHTPQLIAGRIGHMLQLAQALPEWVLFYNGPQCGASAPDHMHFQAGNKGFLTLPDEIATAPSQLVATLGGATISLIEGLSRRVFVIRSSDNLVAERLFDVVLQSLPFVEGADEPMLNLLCWQEGDESVMVVVPRKRHRPSCFGSGPGEFTLSPASVDMGGVFAVPVERDYRELTAPIVASIFDELCLDAVEASGVVDRIRKQMES